MEPLLERAREIVAGDAAPPTTSCATLVRAWVAPRREHRDHMLVFQQERHVIERGPQWREVRATRKAFERLLADVLARGAARRDAGFDDRDLALRALLGMVNHTAQWFRPRGRLTAEQVADGYVDLLVARSRSAARADLATVSPLSRRRRPTRRVSEWLQAP